MAKFAGMLEWKSECPLTQTSYSSVSTQRTGDAAITLHALTLDSVLNRQWEEGVVVEVSISEQAMDLP